MGARSNVKITDTTNADFDFGQRGIYIYSHGHGPELPVMVRDALEAGRERWNDSTYLTRILIDQITKDGRDQTTGFGVGLEPGENSFPMVIVDLGKQTVAIGDGGTPVPFEKYVKE